MATPLDELLNSVVDLRIIGSDAAEALSRSGAIPEGASVGATWLRISQELLKRSSITAFQAEAIGQGRPQDLVYGGKFVCRELLGEGGMGSVYKAWQTSLKRYVALKTISGKRAKAKDARQRFERELEASGRLQHPGIVTVYDGGAEGDELYLAMEHVDGVTLWDKVSADGPRPWREACEWIAQAADGLGYAHRMKVVHRDVKPHNLMLTSQGAIKILDLGLARFLEGGDDLTQTATTMGTIDYMAPEQIEDAKRADARADIYSLGCALHFLCCGKSVFSHRNGTMAVIYAHATEAPPKLRDVCKDTPEFLEAIFQKMVRKSPDDRYQAMAEIADELWSLAGKQHPDPKPAPPIIAEVKADEPPKPPAPASLFEGSRTGQERGDNGLAAKLVWCPPGSFQMGPESSSVLVRLTRGFWIGKYPVTQEEWEKTMGTTIRDQASKNPSGIANSIYGEGPKHPIFYVSYDEALKYCRKLTDREHEAKRLPSDWIYTLPTEAQWEYAARAGTTTRFACGDSLTDEDANFGANVNKATEVGRYPANSWGLCDVHGNVWEWCLDRWTDRLPGGDDPCVKTSNHIMHVYRGGSWLMAAGFCDLAHRRYYSPSSRTFELGFRIAAVRLEA